MNCSHWRKSRSQPRGKPETRKRQERKACDHVIWIDYERSSAKFRADSSPGNLQSPKMHIYPAPPLLPSTSLPHPTHLPKMVSITKAGEPSSSRLAPSHGGSQQGTPSKPSKKGKEKAVNVDSEIVNGSAASHAGMTAWEWTDIAERSDGGQRPVFSNDGRLVNTFASENFAFRSKSANPQVLHDRVRFANSHSRNQCPRLCFGIYPAGSINLDCRSSSSYHRLPPSPRQPPRADHRRSRWSCQGLVLD